MLIHGRINADEAMVTKARYYEALKAVNNAIEDIE